MGRGLFVKYRFTDRRISCITAAPWQSEWSYSRCRSVVCFCFHLQNVSHPDPASDELLDSSYERSNH